MVVVCNCVVVVTRYCKQLCGCCQIVVCGCGQNGSCLGKFEKHVVMQLQKQLYHKFRIEYFDSVDE